MLCMFLLLTGGAAAAPGYSLSVSLPDAIECRDGAFYLGEYAEFAGEDALAGAASMAVLEPRGGYLTRGDVIAALAKTALAGHDISLSMPDRVSVLPEPRIAARLRLIANWKWRIDVQGVSDEHLSGADDFKLPRQVAPGARAVSVKIVRGEKAAGKQAKLRWFQPVVYSLSDLRRGDKIYAHTLACRIDTVGMTKRYASDPGQLTGGELDEPVFAGHAITFDQVKKDGAVRSGTLISLVANVGGLGVTVKGIALERGVPGDVIRVRNLSSRKVVMGKVIDAERVVIAQN